MVEIDVLELFSTFRLVNTYLYLGIISLNPESGIAFKVFIDNKIPFQYLLNLSLITGIPHYTKGGEERPFLSHRH